MTGSQNVPETAKVEETKAEGCDKNLKEAQIADEVVESVAGKSEKKKAGNDVTATIEEKKAGNDVTGTIEEKKAGGDVAGEVEDQAGGNADSTNTAGGKK